MLALRKRCSAAAARASSSKSFWQRRHEVVAVEGRGVRVVELPRSSTWRFPNITPLSPLSRPMLLLAVRGAKHAATPTTTKPKKPGQRAKKQHPDGKSTSGLFVRWEIPWDGKRVVITATALGVSFLFVGLAMTIVFLGFGFKQKQPLNFDEASILLFTSTLLQALVGTSVIKACIKSYSPLPKDLFSYDWRDPFCARRGWLLWGVVGTFCSVAAVLLVARLVNMEQFSMGHDALLYLHRLIGASRTSTALVLASVGILTPFLEETIFRGFLLTSLTKWMPTPAAVLVSSGAFALVHFNPGKFPLLFALGVVLGFSYSKTGNLLTPIMIHGIWNSTVVLVLTFLHHQGYDIKKLIESQRFIRREPVIQTPDHAGKE